MFEEKVRKAIADTPFSDKVTRGVLKVLLGELQLAANPKKPNSKITDEQAYSILRGMIKANEENLQFYKPDDPRVEVSLRENEILASLLPKYLSADQIRMCIEQAGLDIHSQKNAGQAVGLVMRHFNDRKLHVEGAVVKQVVEDMRNQNGQEKA